MWSTETMNGRLKYLYGNPMAKKSDVGQTLKAFFMKLGVPEELKFNGSKDKNSPGTAFMKCCQRNDISLTRTKQERPNHDPAEGVIREIRRRWF